MTLIESFILHFVVYYIRLNSKSWILTVSRLFKLTDYQNKYCHLEVFFKKVYGFGYLVILKRSDIKNWEPSRKVHMLIVDNQNNPKGFMACSSVFISADFELFFVWCYIHKETSRLVYNANQFTGFYVIGKVI